MNVTSTALPTAAATRSHSFLTWLAAVAIVAVLAISLVLGVQSLTRSSSPTTRPTIDHLLDCRAGRPC